MKNANPRGIHQSNSASSTSIAITPGDAGQSSPTNTSNTTTSLNVDIHSGNFLDVEASSICGTSEICDVNYSTIHSHTTASNMAELLQANRLLSQDTNSLYDTVKSTMRCFACGEDSESTSEPTEGGSNCCRRLKKIFFTSFPLFEMITSSNYSWRRDFSSDCIAGFTVAIIQVVQGIAYSLLVGTDPIIGLYTSFFPVIFYSFVGTAHHISLGTMAVVDIMIRDIVKNHAQDVQVIPIDNSSSTIAETTTSSILASSTDSILETITRSAVESSTMAAGVTSPNSAVTLEIVTALSLLVGLIQIAFGIFRIGFVSLVFSDQLVSAFSCGASISVIMSQVPTVLQLDGIGKEGGPLSLVFQLWQILSSLSKISMAALIMSLAVAFSSTIYRDLIDPAIKKKVSFPVPMDLIIVVSVTLISYLVKMDEKYSLRVIGQIPTGLPNPSVPRISLFPSLILESVILSFVIYSLCLSLGKIYARKNSYKVRPNQEFIALGIANALSSFFSCFPSAASLSRTAVMGQYAKSHMSSLVSCFILLFVILFLSPLLFYLPKCAVAAIIIISQRPLLAQVVDLKSSWAVSPWEGLIWLVTFSSVVLLGMDYGLLLGIAFSIFSIVLRFVNPKLRQMGQLSDTGIFLDVTQHTGLHELSGIRILQFSSPLFFLNRDLFKKRMMALTSRHSAKKVTNDANKCHSSDFSPREVKKARIHQCNQQCDHSVDGCRKIDSPSVNTTDAQIHCISSGVNISKHNRLTRDNELFGWRNSKDNVTSDPDNRCKHDTCQVDCGKSIAGRSEHLTSESTLHTVIIDCTSMAFIDSAGVSTLAEVSNELQAKGISVIIASCSPSIIYTLSKCNFFDVSPTTIIEPSVTAAISRLTQNASNERN